MFRNFFISLVRNLSKNRMVHVTNLVGLSVGLATCILIAIWVEDELSYDRFHKDHKDIYLLVNEMGNGWWSASPFVLTDYLKRDFPEVELTTRTYTLNRLIHYGEKRFLEECGFVDPEFFKIFSFPVVRGIPDHLFDVRRSVVITERIAYTYFGEENPIGKYLEISNIGKYLVTGVMKDFPANSSIRYDILFPMQEIIDQLRQYPDALWSYEVLAYVKLKPGTDVNGFRAKLAGTCNRYDPRPGKNNCINDIQNITRLHLHALNGTPGILYIYILSLTGGFILLLACINFINLTTAYSSVRGKEIGIRKVNGAARSSLVRQFLGEALLTSYIAMGIALLLVYLILPDINTIMSKELSLGSGIGSWLLLFLFLIPMVTGFLSGILPAFIISSFQPAAIISSKPVPGSSAIWLRRSLVIFQFSIAIVIMICTWISARQLRYMLSKDLGFDKENILVFRNNRTLIANFDPFWEELLRDPGITCVSYAQSLPLRFTNNNTVYVQGQSTDDEVMVNDTWVGCDYVRLFGMAILEGRDFNRNFTGDSSSCLVNEEMVRVLNLTDPVGKTIYHFPEDTVKIIGVVRDFHAFSVHHNIPPVIILPNPTRYSAYIFVKTSSYPGPATIDHIKKCWLDYAGDYPFEYRFLTDHFQQQYTFDEQMMRLFRYFTVIAIIIALLGLYGLSVFMIRQRTREIAIRKVFGASVTSIIGHLSSRFLALIVLSNLIAWPVAFMLGRYLLATYAYKAKIPFWLYFLVGGITLGIAFSVVIFHALRAARTNPSETLKYE